MFKKAYPVTVAGVTVDEAPQKVAVLTDAAAGYINALGYSSYLYGAPTTFVKVNKSNTALVDLGSALLVNEEALLELSPDVLIISEDLSTDLMDKLTIRNVKVLKLNTPNTYDEVKKYYAELIKLFVGEKEYEEVKTAFLTELESKVEAIKSANSATDKKVAVYVEKDYLVTGDTLAGELLDMVGINNIAKDSKNYIMAKELVVSANPDVVFCAKGESDSILKNEAFKDTAAAKKAAVYEIDVTGVLYGCDGFAALQDMVTYITGKSFSVDNEAETKSSSTTDKSNEENKSNISSKLVNKNLGNTLTGTVNITIPIELLELSGEKFDYKLTEENKKNGFTDIKKNDDGSATYTIKKKDYEEFINQTKQATKQGLDEIAENKDFNSIKTIEYNDDFSEIILNVNKEEFESSFDSIAITACSLSSRLYQMFVIDSKNKCVIIVKDIATGEIIRKAEYPEK